MRLGVKSSDEESTFLLGYELNLGVFEIRVNGFSRSTVEDVGVFKVQGLGFGVSGREFKL